MLGNPLASLVKPLQQLGHELPQQIRAALRDVLAPLSPPPGAEPIYWSARATVAATTTEEWGVQWVPGVDSTSGNASSSSFRIVADSPKDAGGNEPLAQRQRFLPGFRGLVWAECVVGNTSVAAPGGIAPQLQCMWSLFLNGNAVPGFLRQHVGGGAWREVAAPNVNAQLAVRAELPCPIPLEQGDTMSVHLHNDLAVALDMLVVVRGFRWRPA